MKRTRTFLTAALALVLAACNVESDFLSPKKDLYTETITVSANRDGVDIDGSEGTRAVLTVADTQKSVWETGDQLTVWTGDEFTEDNMSERGFTLDSGADTNSATFTGKVKSASKPNRSTVLTAVVDKDDDAVVCSSGTTAALDFSEQESCTTSTVLRYDALWAQATYGDRDFHFAHTMSFVEWTITIGGISAATTCNITLSATGMQNKAELDLAQGVLTGTNAGDITLKNVSIDAQGEAVVYVALFPGQVTSKITAVVTMADGKMTGGQLGTFDSFTFEANKHYTAAWIFGAPAEPTYTFTATSPAAIEYNATSTGNYTVTSYATVGSIQQPVAWEVTKYEYSDDDGANWTDNGTAKPSWLSTLSLESGEGSVGGENGTAAVTAAELIDQNPVTAKLKAATAKSNYDLSQGGETANCYVISAPGTYKIPLVYGNLRNSSGGLNTAAQETDATLKETFVSADGTNLSTVTSPNIQGITANTQAALVWKDVDTEIVTNLAVDATNNFLTFTVPQSAIKQGNAVVGIKNGDGYLWSWHLWFTESDALSTIAFNNSSSETLYFTRDNLGYVIDTYSGTSYTAPRRVRVTVTQAGSNQTATFEVIQNPSTSSITFHDTKYQFGRKDAFSDVTTGAPTFTAGGTTYQNAIQTPGVFYTKSSSPYDWCSTTYNNGWAVGNTNTANSVSTSAITKSVYDPCPAGFKMPGSNAFTGFSTGNGTWAKGYTFTDSSNGTSVFFPAAGYRSSSSGALSDVGSNGNYWSAVPDVADGAWSLLFFSDEFSDEVGPQSSVDRALGFSVRPVQSN